MMKPDKNYKMDRTIKTRLALGKFKNAHDRGEYKRSMIDAQLSSEAARRAALKSKTDKDLTSD